MAAEPHIDDPVEQQQPGALLLRRRLAEWVQPASSRRQDRNRSGGIEVGFAQSRILDLHGKRIIDRNFAPGFKTRLHRKDMNIALQAGKELSVPLYGSAQVAAHMDALIAQGKGEYDHSAIALLIEQLSNIS